MQFGAHFGAPSRAEPISQPRRRWNHCTRVPTRVGWFVGLVGLDLEPPPTLFLWMRPGNHKFVNKFTLWEPKKKQPIFSRFFAPRFLTLVWLGLGWVAG